MKKCLITTAILLVVGSGFLAAQSEADNAYRTAMTQSDPCQQYQMLKDFIAKYGGKGCQYENWAYVYLCLSQCPSSPVGEKIGYGEKATAMSELDDLNKIKIRLALAQFYLASNQNLEKGKVRAGEIVSLAKAVRDKDPGEAQWTKYMGLGYFISGAVSEKAKNYKEAVESYLQAQEILKDPKSIAQINSKINKLANTLLEAKQFGEAEQIFRTMYNKSKDPNMAVLLGQTLYKSGKQDEALTFYKEVYAKKKSGTLANNIGIILAKKSPQEAIDYFLEAGFLYPSGSAEAQQALGRAQSLFFNSSSDSKINDVINKIQEKSKAIDDLTKKFNTKFVDKNEEDLTEEEKAEMKKILADIDALKAERAKLQASSAEMTDKWAKRMEEVRKKIGTR